MQYVAGSMKINNKEKRTSLYYVGQREGTNSSMQQCDIILEVRTVGKFFLASLPLFFSGNFDLRFAKTAVLAR